MTEPATASAAGPGLASPLSLLLEEERHGDRQAEDVLLLSFTTDLGFFEAFGLGVAQACGARVTVVGDAAMSAPDPRAARRAGRTYLPGQAICGGAFHPKLVAVVGPDRATIAIGSGNATLAGWQTNAELWTVLHGDTTACPAVMGDLAGWLRQLLDLVRFSRGVPEALARIAAGLDGLLAAAAEILDDGTRLVSTSPGPILDQLPVGPVSELAVCAPFHDPGAVALRALVQRLRPERLLIAYQPELTELDGPAVAALTREVDTELRVDGEHRYRHGKLIEWTVDGPRWALTGSPNLSGAALLRGLAEGGNCELGLISPVPASLLPEGALAAPAAVHAQRFTIRTRASEGPLVLGATRVEQGLHVLFARPLPVGGHLQLSHAAAAPETWERIGEVAAGATEVTLTVAADGGSRLRLVTSGHDGTPRYGNLVFVVDPVRATRRPSITASHVPTTRPDALFEDPRLAERFFADLLTLKAGLPPAPPRMSAATRAEQEAVSARLDDDLDGWERYLDECAGRLGHPLLRFALGLPALPSGPEMAFEALLPVSWAEESISDKEAGLADEKAEAVADEHADQSTPTVAMLPDLSAAEPGIRRRYRRWAERMTEAAPQLGAPERMLVTRLLLWTAAAGAWDRDDHAWVSLLAQSLRSLGEAELPLQAEPHVGSLAAVAVSVLRAQAPRYAGTEETLAYEQAAEAVGHLLVVTDPAYIEEYRQLLGGAIGAAVEPETVDAVISDIVQGDRVADAMWALRDLGRDVHRRGERLLHVTGTFGNPLLAALEAVSASQDAGLIGAWASSTNGTWALCMWDPPDLFTVDASRPRLLWRHYRLSNLQTPRGLVLQKSLETATAVRHGAFVQSFPEVLDALGRLGLSGPEPPSRCDE